MGWYHRVWNSLRSGRVARDVNREIEFHLAERADELMAAGMSEADARREARRRFGNVTTQREWTHDMDVALWLESVLSDLKYAVRALLHSPGFAAVAILSLALGIGASTAIFSLINAVMLRSLPVRHPEELVQMTLTNRTVFTNPLWEAIRDRQQVLSGAFAYGGARFDLANGGEARRVRGNWVSGGYFNVLGVVPVAGRLLTPADDYGGCPAVAALSYGLWQREFGGRPDAIGRTLSLDGHPFQVVGVVDPAFTGVDVGSPAEVYAPLCAEAIVNQPHSMLDGRSTWFLQIMGRLPAGLSPSQTTARLAAITPQVLEATLPPDWGPKDQAEYLANTFAVRSAPQGLSGLRRQYHDALLVLLAVVAVVLLIACGNVANLLLVRATGRRHEIAVRRAIGSGRGRLVRQLVTESLVLSVLGAALGVLFARWASRLLVGLLASGNTVVWLDLSLDLRVLGFALAVATGTGALFGLAPAWRSTRVAPSAAMRIAGRGSSSAEARFAAGKGLVVAQLGLSLALVMGAGLLIGTFRRLVTLDPGFHRDGVLLVNVDLSNAGYADAALATVDRGLLDDMRSIPGVRTASASWLTPISNTFWNDFVDVEGYTPTERRDALVWFNGVSGDYFATLGTSLLAGRDFDRRDTESSPKVAVISAATAQKFFHDPHPIGRQFHTNSPRGPGPMIEVVGVVEDSKYATLDEETVPQAYVPLSQSSWGPSLMLELKTAGDPMAVVPAVKDRIASVNPRISLELTTFADQVAASLTRPRLLAVLSGFFGAVALMLAMIGLYGTLSYAVVSRRSEIGVRLALGAAPGRVLRMVLGEVSGLVVAGLALGVAVALVSTKLLAAFLFGVTATDLPTLLRSVVGLTLVALVASALPAWRAARLDPMVVLRQE